MTVHEWFFGPSLGPVPAILLVRTLTRRAVVIESRVYLDQLHKVLASRASDALLLRPPFEWRGPL